MFLLIDKKYTLSFPLNGGPHFLVSSPISGYSIFITSAPKSDNINEVYGPTNMRDASIIQYPLSKGSYFLKLIDLTLSLEVELHLLDVLIKLHLQSYWIYANSLIVNPIHLYFKAYIKLINYI